MNDPLLGLTQPFSIPVMPVRPASSKEDDDTLPDIRFGHDTFDPTLRVNVDGEVEGPYLFAEPNPSYRRVGGFPVVGFLTGVGTFSILYAIMVLLEV